MSCGPGSVAFAFDVTNPEAVAWVNQNAGLLIREITEETRLAVRAIIKRSFEDGIPPREAAKLVRSVVGLTERQAQAVANLRARLVAKGVNKSRVTARTSAYADKLLRNRALTIARTETMRASNEGQQQLWRQARQGGYLSPSVKREWIATDDERTCPICGPLDGVVVGLEEPFKLGLQAPPAHPRCRCTIGLAAVAVRKVKAANEKIEEETA